MTLNDKQSAVDLLLKEALSSTETPPPGLVSNLKSALKKEEPIVHKFEISRIFRTVAAAAAVLALLTTTAFAAWFFLKPGAIASRLGDKTLAEAFKTADIDGRSITSGEYVFTLLGVVSGMEITDSPTYNGGGDVLGDRSYAVVAIQRKDGSPMPAVEDPAYGYPPFYISPYIKGLKPWQVNAHTLNGGHIDTVAEGVMYRLLECDEVTMFADRGIYLGINTGKFYNSKAFSFDEETGVLTANPEYSGSSAVFDLPVDRALANPAKARQYLDSLPGMGSAGGGPLSGDPVPIVLEGAMKNGAGLAMSYDEYKAWTDQKLEETRKLVKQGKYSRASMELDRRDYESNLLEIQNGGTLTLIEYDDGSCCVCITYPVEGCSVTIGDDGIVSINEN